MGKEETTTGTRKAMKNPFAKIHQVAINNDGTLSEETRKKMMKEAVRELRGNIQEPCDIKR